MKSDSGGVAMVVPFLNHLGGMEQVALSLARRFHAEGIPTLLLTCRHLRDQPARLRSLPAIAVPVLSHGVLQRPPLLDLTWVIPGALRLYVRRGCLRAIIAHQLPTAGVLAGLASIWTGLPFGVVTHGGGAHGDAAMLERLPGRRMRTAALNRAAFVTSLNPGLDQELFRAGIDRRLVRRVPNACDIETFRPPTAEERLDARAARGIAGDELVLVFTGRLAEEKRLSLLLDGFRLLSEVRPARLLIAGDGPERRRLEERAGRHVTFLGRVEEVLPVLWAGDLFCLPSVSEGMSLALLEAMAAGLPAVVSDVPANREVVTHGRDGFLVPGTDPESWRRRILDAGEPGAALANMGGAARATVERRFRPDQVESFFLDWFRSL